jgi:cell division protein ZipA
MDATTLRIVLFVAGIFFLGGIYLYETQRRKRESAQARRRASPKVDHTLPPQQEVEELEEDIEPDTEPVAVSNSEGRFEEVEEEITERLDEEEPIESFRIDDEPIPGIDEPLPLQGDVSEQLQPGSKAAQSMKQQDMFGFSAQEESPVDVPNLIIQINIRAREVPFEGPAIEKATHETGLVLSDLAIYQRLASDGSHKVLYNLASMVEPGIFPAKQMAGFSTPGVTLFAQLPGPGDSLMIFSDMLYTAERLASMLEGDLQDESHSALTKQTIEHLRERIMEQKRQIQLARRKG